MNTIDSSIVVRPQFSALTCIKYGGRFNPDKELLHAKTINSFINAEHFKKLSKKYDVEAKFSASVADKKAKTGANASIDLYLSKTPTTFWGRLKNYLGLDKFTAHINHTETHSSDYNKAVESLDSSIRSDEFGSSVMKEADTFFQKEQERKDLMNKLRNGTSIYSESEIFF